MHESDEISGEKSKVVDAQEKEESRWKSNNRTFTFDKEVTCNEPEIFCKSIWRVPLSSIHREDLGGTPLEKYNSHRTKVTTEKIIRVRGSYLSTSRFKMYDCFQRNRGLREFLAIL